MIPTVYCQAHGGSHFLRAIRYALGDTNAFNIIMCKPGRTYITDGTVALIRDPRNRLISQYRFWEKKKRKRILKLCEQLPDMDERLAHLTTMLDGNRVRQNYLETTKQFIEFLNSRPEKVIKLKFEDLTKEPTMMSALLQALDIEADAEEIYTKSFGKSRTYTGKFSNWREYFGTKCEELWQENADLLKALNYE